MENGSSPREIFKQVAAFQKKGILAHFEAMGFWDETVTRWHNEGLPVGQSPWEYFRINRLMDNAPEKLYAAADRVTQPFYWPAVETRVIEETASYTIRQDEDGIIKKIRKGGVSMPQFLQFPVQDKQDWKNLKWRLDPNVKERYRGVAEIASDLNGRGDVLRFGVCGCYGFQRNLFGEERLAYLYYDDPQLLAEVMDHWLDFYVGVADHLCPLVDFDYLFLWEDMAYNHSSLISPDLFRRFILPYHRELISHLKQRYGFEIFMVDSDGNNSSILPLFVEGGINIFIPCEVAAGMEPGLIREKFPQLALFGGIDKRVLIAGDKKRIEAEIMRKVPALLEQGGYFPSLDHHVPPDVSFESFCHYLECLRKLE